MRIVYTYCNIKGNKPSEFFFNLAKVAVASMKKFSNYKCYLYTDCAEWFNDFPFDDIIDVDFFDWNWDKRYWNIPKLKTYTLQTEPFIHFDLDVIVMPNFKVDACSNFDFVSEKLRMIERDQYPYRHLSKELSDGMVLCSGIFGRTNDKARDLFDELYYEKARNECFEGCNETVEFDDLYSIEEHWMYYRVLQEGFSIYTVPQYMFFHCSGDDKEMRFSTVVQRFAKGFKVLL